MAGSDSEYRDGLEARWAARKARRALSGSAGIQFREALATLRGPWGELNGPLRPQSQWRPSASRPIGHGHSIGGWFLGAASWFAGFAAAGTRLYGSTTARTSI